MTTLAALGAAVLVKASELTNRTFSLPLAVYSPTSRCNSRCLSCDWWRSTGEDDLSLPEVQTLVHELSTLGTRLVVFSGGEPLMRPDVMQIADLFAGRGMALHLLTSGLALERHAKDVARRFARVIVSIDSATSGGYRDVRGVPAFERVLAGIEHLKRAAPTLPITARATIHRHNYRDMSALVALAKRLPLDGLSFLAADVHSAAFGRHEPNWAHTLTLTREEVEDFRRVVDGVVRDHRDAFETGLVRESPEKLRRLPDYYAALLGEGPFPPVSCNAPWASVVIDANGHVRPCFFHDPVGSLRETSLATLVRTHLPRFRAALEVSSNTTCQRCVCSLNVRVRSQPWT